MIPPISQVKIVIIEPAVSTTPQPRRKLRDGIEPDLRRMNRDLRTYRKVRRSPSIGAAIWTAVVRKSSDSSAGRAGQFRASSKIYVAVAPSLSLDFFSFAMRRSWVRIPSRPPKLKLSVLVSHRSAPRFSSAPQVPFRLPNQRNQEKSSHSRFSRRTVHRPEALRTRRPHLRCQAMTVSGLTMVSAERQPRQRRDRQIHNRRSAEVNCRRFAAALRSTPIW